MTDARRGSAAWKRIRAYWQGERRPDCEATVCLLPGIPIRYTGQRGVDSLDVGHRRPAVADQRTSWTVEDTRPEHARCNRSEGVAIGRARARPTPPRQGEQSITASRW